MEQITVSNRAGKATAGKRDGLPRSIRKKGVILPSNASPDATNGRAGLDSLLRKEVAGNKKPPFRVAFSPHHFCTWAQWTQLVIPVVSVYSLFPGHPLFWFIR